MNGLGTMSVDELVQSFAHQQRQLDDLRRDVAILEQIDKDKDIELENAMISLQTSKKNLEDIVERIVSLQELERELSSELAEEVKTRSSMTNTLDAIDAKIMKVTQENTAELEQIQKAIADVKSLRCGTDVR